MLALSLEIGADHYAIPASQIVEVIPLTSLKIVPLAPQYIAGILDYHGTLIPVIDLCALITHKPHNKVLTTRIILFNYNSRNSDEKHLLGVIAERVTETLQIHDDTISQNMLRIKSTPYMGSTSKQNGNVIQLINADELLSDEIRNMLYQKPQLTENESKHI